MAIGFNINFNIFSENFHAIITREGVNNTEKSENYAVYLALKTLNIATKILGATFIGLQFYAISAGLHSIMFIPSSMLFLTGIGMFCLAKIFEIVHNLLISKDKLLINNHPLMAIAQSFDQLVNNVRSNANSKKFYLEEADISIINTILSLLSNIKPSSSKDEVLRKLRDFKASYLIGNFPLFPGSEAERHVTRNFLLLREIQSLLPSLV